MADPKEGDDVVAKKHHAELRAGDKGKIVSKHTGTFYGVATQGGVAYVPSSNVDPDNDGDNDGGVADPPGVASLMNDSETIRAMAYHRQFKKGRG